MTENKLQYPGVDHYEEQLLWVRIFESICKVAAKNQVPSPIDMIVIQTWNIYNGLGKLNPSAAPNESNLEEG